MQTKRYNKYKMTAINWLKEIPEHWNLSRLKYLIRENVTDGPHETPSFKLSGIVFLSVDSIQNGEISFKNTRFISKEDHVRYSKKANPEKGDILLGKAASIGKIAQIKVDETFSIWSPLALIKPNHRILSSIMEYQLKSNFGQYQIEIFSNSNTQKNLGMKDIPRLLLVDIPLEEQAQIASYLDNKTSLIEALIINHQKTIRLLEEKKKALINNVITKGLNPNVEMKDSGVEWIGKIPIHWKVKKIKYLLSDNKDALKPGPFGSDLKNSDIVTNGDFKVYTQRNVMDSDFRSGNEYITEDKFHSLSNFEIKANDILITTRGTIGKASIFPNDMIRGILHPCLIRMQINPEMILKKWLLTYINDSDGFRNNIKYNSNSTVIDVIYGYTLREIFVPLPPRDEQGRLIKYIDSEKKVLDELIERYKKQNTLLNEYKQSLIYHAVTGKVDVRDEVKS